MEQALDGALHAPEPEELPPPEPPPPPPSPEPTFGKRPAQASSLSEEEVKLAYAKFLNTDMTVVGEVLDRLNKYPALGSAYDLDVRVTPLGGQGTLGRFEMHEVLAQDISPPDKMRDIVIERFHIPTASGPVTYDAQIVWRKTGRVYARFRLPLPSRDQLMALRRAADDARMRAGAVPSGPPGYGYAPQGGGYAPRAPEYPGAGYAPAGGQNAQIDRALSEIATMRGALSEALAAAREGRRPNEETLRAAMGPQDEVAQLRADVSRLAGLVERLVTAPTAPPAPAPPPPPATVAAPPPPNPFETVVRGGVEKVLLSVLKTTLSGLENAAAAGLGAAPPEATPTEAVAEVAAPHDPKEDMPFDLIDVAQWSDGRPVKFARNKETGGVHWMGIASGNPVLTETAMGIVDKLVQPLAHFMNDKLTHGAAHVVDQVPKSAVNAGPAHVTPPPATAGPPLRPPAPPPPAPAGYPGM